MLTHLHSGALRKRDPWRTRLGGEQWVVYSRMIEKDEVAGWLL